MPPQVWLGEPPHSAAAKESSDVLAIYLTYEHTVRRLGAPFLSIKAMGLANLRRIIVPLLTPTCFHGAPSGDNG